MTPIFVFYQQSKQSNAEGSVKDNIIRKKIICNNCDEEEVKIDLNDFPYHTMNHVVTDQQLRINTVDIQIKDNDGIGSDKLILCYLCIQRYIFLTYSTFQNIITFWKPIPFKYFING